MNNTQLGYDIARTINQLNLNPSEKVYIGRSILSDLLKYKIEVDRAKFTHILEG